MAHFTALYDACVLYPAPLRDLLMRLAVTDRFRAKWTNEIHEEWIRNVLEDRPDLTRTQLERTRDLMNAHVRDCLVDDYRHLLPSLSLPDPNDRHILAAAIHARADVIVTFNLKDFPAATLRPLNIKAQHPDEFINHLIDLDIAAVVIAAQKCRAGLKAPPKTAEEYLEALERQSLPKTVAALRQWVTIL
jgi:predicted nucleic acid-binding protein